MYSASVRSVLFTSLLLATTFSSAHDKAPVTTTTTTTSTTVKHTTTTTTCPKKATTTTTTLKKPTTTTTTSTTSTTVKHTTTTTTSTTLPISHNPPPTSGTTVFGPKEFRVGFLGRSTNSDSFNGLTQTPQNGTLIVTLGGDDLHCGPHPKFICELEQSLEKYLRPKDVEITLNGQVVLKHHGYSMEQKYDSVAVVVNATNDLKVSLKGMPFSYVDVEVKSQGSAQHPNPLASFTVTPTAGIAPQLYTFNALASTASGATISSYAWEFGDGQADVGSIVVHNYVNAGTYAVKLTVTDSLGGVGTATQNVVVKQNQLPIPSFTATVEPENSLLVHFDASASVDNDGSIVSYSWNFGDGQVGTGVQIDHTFVSTATYPVALTVTDDKNGSSTQTQQISVKDTIPPVLSMQSPSAGSTIQSLSISVAGSSNKTLSSVTAQLDGESTVNLTLGADQKSFSQSITAAHDGARVLTVVATDLSGNTATAQIHFNIVVNIPPIAKLTITEPPSNVAPVMVMFDASASSSPQGKALHYHFDFGDGNSVDNTNGITSHQFAVAGTYTVVVSVIDSSNTQAQAQTVIVAANAVIPPAASNQAPSLSTSSPQAMVDTVRFLYSDDNPVQTNVQDGAIDPDRIAVLQGTVVDADGNPIAGVKITVLEMPQIGQTFTDANGQFHIAANGGGVLTIKYERNGYFPVQRKISTTALDYFTADKIIMTAPDSKVSQVTMASPSIQVVQGSMVSDSSGARTSVLVLPAGTTASLQMPDGSTKQVNTLSLRTTEYTVGPDGQKKMPGDLPATTSYTYAQDISADEAIAAGASHIVFSNPVPNYVDNFLNFPVGVAVPYGSYDYNLGAWIPEKDGVVLKVLDVQNGQAVLDMDGSGTPATPDKLSQIQITGDELSKIASLYSPGKSFWRVLISHLSPGDYNWVFAGNPNAIPTTISPFTGNPDDCQCGLSSTGSIISVDRRSLGEKLNLSGIPSSLNYASITKPGYSSQNQINVPLIFGNLSSNNSISNIHLHIELAGQVFDQDYQPQSNLVGQWTWDGKDSFGRDIFGSVVAHVTVTYDSPSLYYVGPFIVDAKTFGSTVQNMLLSGVYGRANSQLTTTADFGIASAKYRNSADVGGWTFDQLHRYDPVGKSLFMGDGSIIDTSKLSSIVAVIGGSSYQTGNSGDGDYLINARFSRIANIQIGPDNSIYILDNTVIRKVTPDGIINRVVGNGSGGITTDGTLAVNSPMGTISQFAVGPDNSIYFALSNENKIKKVTPDGILHTIAGTGGYNFSGDGGPALQAQMRGPTDLIRTDDGTIYFIDRGNDRIRKISPDGTISTFAGTGVGDSTGDEGSALNAALYYPSSLAIGKNKEIYFIESSMYQIRVITNDGIIHHFAGTKGVSGLSNGENIPASQAIFNYISAIDVGRDGALYVADYYNGLIRKITSDGLINTIAGNPKHTTNDGTQPYFTNVAATNLLSYRPFALKIYNRDQFLMTQGPDISIYQPALPDINPDGYSIGSADGTEVYQFSSLGVHLQTLFARTGKVKWSFGYDQLGHMISMTDANGNVTKVNRDQNGNPNSIVGPYGQTSLTSLTPDGYLASVSSPTGETTTMSYFSGGLLSEFKQPKGNSSTFQYDSTGKLLKDTDAAGGFKSFTQTIVNSFKYTVTQLTAMGRATVSTVDKGTANVFTYYNTTFSNGNQATQTQGVNSYDYSDNQGTQYDGYNHGIDPRLAGITQFYTYHFGNYDYVNEDNQYTPLSPDDYFNFIQYKTKSIQTNAGAFLTYKNTYNSQTKTESIVTGLGRSQTNIYDDKERIVQSSIGVVTPYKYSYNPDGSIASISQGVRSTTYSYNNLGQVVSKTDAVGNQTQYVWDASDRLTQVVRPDGKVIKYTYDGNSNVTGIQPPDRLPHAFTSNSIDLMSSYMPPGDSIGYKYTYNLDRQLQSYSRPDGSTVNFVYDGPTGNLTNINGTSKNILFQYSYNGALNNENSSDGVNIYNLKIGGYQPYRQYKYHDINSVVTINNSIGSEGRLDLIKYYTDYTTNVPEVTISNTFDNDNLIIKAGDLSLVRDTLNGLVTSSQLGNITQSLQYNSYGEVSQDSSTLNGGSLYSASYIRDSLGRISQKTETVLGVTTVYSYTYDSVGRLSTVSQNGTQTAAYTYDSNGNILSNGTSAGSYDGQDKISQFGNSSYSFDINGSLSQKQNGNDLTKYQYDDFGNLSQVNLPSGHVITYLMDGETKRAEKLMDGVSYQKFMYNQDGFLVAELLPTAKMKSTFVYSSDKHSPDYMLQSGTEYKFIKDQIGSIRLVVDSNTGIVKQRLDYDEYGRVLQDTNPGFQPFGFAGGIYDPDTKLVRFGARDYDAEIGRWTARDPSLFSSENSGLQLADLETNLFSYCGQDPVNRIDPNGKKWYSVVGTALWVLYVAYVDHNKKPQAPDARDVMKEEMHKADAEVVPTTTTTTPGQCPPSPTGPNRPVRSNLPWPFPMKGYPDKNFNNSDS